MINKNLSLDEMEQLINEFRKEIPIIKGRIGFCPFRRITFIKEQVSSVRICEYCNFLFPNKVKLKLLKLKPLEGKEIFNAQEWHPCDAFGFKTVSAIIKEFFPEKKGNLK